MYELLHEYPDLLRAFIPISVAALTILGLTGMVQFRKYKTAKLDADLKTNMLDRGMSAEEIEHVIGAKPGGGR
jgi:hypothetical protein